MHIGFKRHLKCPYCNKKYWMPKVFDDEKVTAVYTKREIQDILDRLRYISNSEVFSQSVAVIPTVPSGV